MHPVYSVLLLVDPENFIEPMLVEYITKTYLYNFDPLKPHFYIVKLGFTSIYIMFSFLLRT